VEILGLPMLIIVVNVFSKKKIGMAVQRLSIWGLRKRIYFMSGKSMDSRKDSKYLPLLHLGCGMGWFTSMI
jgi:hypothetical protein